MLLKASNERNEKLLLNYRGTFCFFVQYIFYSNAGIMSKFPCLIKANDGYTKVGAFCALPGLLYVSF